MKAHTFHVVSEAQTHNNTVLTIAALFHDIGNASCRLRKIPESELEIHPEREELAYAYRIEHMFWSILRTTAVMKELNFTAETILEVIKLVGKHDLRKCDPTYQPEGVELLLNIADARWMLTPDGIKRDQDRARENGLPVMSDEEQLKWNKERVSDIIE